MAKKLFFCQIFNFMFFCSRILLLFGILDKKTNRFPYIILKTIAMLSRYLYLPLLLLSFFGLSAQQNAEIPAVYEQDAREIRRIYDQVLQNSSSYDWLHYLTKRIGARLSGTPEAAAAVEYTRQMMDTLGLDDVRLEPCMVPHWQRGTYEEVRIVHSNKVGSRDLKAVALGGSIGTGPLGITADVVEVHSLNEVDTLGAAGVAGKIVFYNRPMDPTRINTFNAYGGAVDQRALGAARAGKYGAVGVLVRSMTTELDDIPHTGSMTYLPDINPIPAMGISTNDAALLSRLLQEEEVRIFMRNNSSMATEKPSYNVIGEIRGSTHPDEIILVGGHLDSWDLGEGAHDDGAGCVQSLGVIEALKQLGYKPKRTIRCVMFMNEENGLRGGRTYWENSFKAGEYHLGAIESDRGGFTPRGFSAEGHPDIFAEGYKYISQWLPLLEPYGITFEIGGSGADIGGLKDQKGMLFGLVPDSQRYFDIHHTAADVLENVNKRELELGTAAMAALVYLLDQYGIKE